MTQTDWIFEPPDSAQLHTVHDIMRVTRFVVLLIDDDCTNRTVTSAVSQLMNI